MDHRLTSAGAVAVVLTLGLPNGAVTETDSDQRSVDSTDASEENDGEGEGEGASNSDEEMTEKERQKWRERKRRSRKIAIRDAAAPGGWLERSWTWDLTFDTGLRLLGESEGWTFQGRTGVTRIAEPGAYSAGVTGQIDTNGRPLVGIEIEILSLNLGTFMRIGGATALQGGVRWSAGLGWQLFGIEAAVEPATPEGPRWTGLAELRLPVSWIIRAVSDEDEDE
jgi:hypothetical protein